MNFTQNFLLLTVVTAALGLAQEPQLIRGLSAMNAASYVPAGLPHAGVAPGSRVVLLGRDFGFAEPLQQETADSLTLGGVSARVTAGGSTVEAYVMYVSANRVEMLLPRDTATGTATMTVVVNGKELSAPVNVVPRAPGIRTNGAMGVGSAVAFNASTQPITASNPAAAGELARLVTTGIGSEDALSSTEILVAGTPVPAAGITRRSNGYDEIDFEVPAGANGCAVPVAIRIGAVLSNFATLPVGASGTPCVDPSQAAGVDYDRLSREGGRIGSISVRRSELSAMGFKMQSDAGGASFTSFTAGSFGDSSGSPFSITVGACTLIRTIEQDLGNYNLVGLDAGPELSVNGPQGARKMERVATGSYAGRFGEKMLIDIPGIPSLPGGLFLDPGDYTIAGTGGADVGAFSAVLSVGRMLTWTNAETLGSACGEQRCVNRAQDLPITWTPGENNRMVTVMGMSVAAQRPAVAAMFYCTERADKGTLTVPAAILSALPASPSGDAESAITFTVTPIAAPVTFTASGLDLGTITYTQSVLRTVAFK